jgi:hypothetical protein
MQFIGVLKRVIPFFLTFAAGLFIASFFVTIAAPFEGVRKDRSHKWGKYNRLKVENERLKRENCRLKKELDETGSYGRGSGVTRGSGTEYRHGATHRNAFQSDLDLAVPPPPPPPAPVREMKMRTVTIQ